MSISPEALEDGEFQDCQLSTAHTMFTEAGADYVQAIDAALLAPDYQIHDVCQRLGVRAGRLLSTGQMMASVVYIEDPANAAEIMAGSIMAHNFNMASQFKGHCRHVIKVEPVDDAIKNIQEEIETRLLKNESSEPDPARAFSLAVREVIFANARAWTEMYELYDF